ncbi:UNKNOWN [Stylonychia lemnae]|uniref:Uncharacterized protein n=1 Tax=Stylonychia lemnae TaxID=5949 RepID=A0A077ZNP0_STYLE|nr:UNKNOWN [Stylonychia lemnae]|eukprot:CDW71587.1 UNKNOWN [Stylonychia lemnae]
MSDIDERDDFIEDDYYMEAIDDNEVIDLGEDVQPFSLNLNKNIKGFQGNIFLKNYEQDQHKVKTKYNSYSDDEFEQEADEDTQDFKPEPVKVEDKQEQNIFGSLKFDRFDEEQEIQIAYDNEEDERDSDFDKEQEDKPEIIQIENVQSPEKSFNDDEDSNNLIDQRVFNRFSSTFKFNGNEFQDFKKTKNYNNEEESDHFRDNQFDFDDFQPIQDETFEDFDFQPEQRSPLKEKNKNDDKDQDPAPFNFEFSKSSKKLDQLSLLRGGTDQQIDIRKGISVEKYFTDKKEIEVIQHNDKKEEPEMLSNKNVEIIKQTKHDKFFEVQKAKEEQNDDEDEIEEERDFGSDDSDLERDDQERDKDLDELFGFKKENVEKLKEDKQKEVDDGTIKLDFNFEDWITGVKYERWCIIDGARPQNETSDKTVIEKQVKISKRLNHIMERLFQNIMKKNQKIPTQPIKFKKRSRFIANQIEVMTDFMLLSEQQIMLQPQNPQIYTDSEISISKQIQQRMLKTFQTNFQKKKIPIIIEKCQSYRDYVIHSEYSYSKVDQYYNNSLNDEKEIQYEDYLENYNENAMIDEQFTQQIKIQLRPEVIFNQVFQEKKFMSPQKMSVNNRICVLRQEILPFETSFETQSRSNLNNQSSIQSSSSKKIRISRKSIQFIQQATKEAKTKAQQLNQDEVPQRSSSSFPYSDRIQNESQNLGGKLFPVKMIKIKLNDGQKTKPLLKEHINKNSMIEEEKNQKMTNSVVKNFSKSIQNRIREFQAVNPKLLKIKKNFMNPQGKSNQQQSQQAKSLGINSTSEEVFDNIKQQLMSQKRLKADLFRSCLGDKSQTKEISTIVVNQESNLRVSKQLSLKNQTNNQFPKAKISRMSELIKNNHQVLHIEDLDQKSFTEEATNEISEIQSEDRNNMFFNYDTSNTAIKQPRVISIDMYQNYTDVKKRDKSRNLEESMSLDEIKLPENQFLSFGSNGSSQNSNRRELKNTILTANLPSNKNITASLSPSNNRPVKIKENQFNSELIAQHIKDITPAKQMINNFLS